MNSFITALMKKMTIDENLGQLNLITAVSKTGPFATKNEFFNGQLVWNWEPGELIVYIGTNSREVKKARFVWNCTTIKT